VHRWGNNEGPATGQDCVPQKVRCSSGRDVRQSVCRGWRNDNYVSLLPQSHMSYLSYIVIESDMYRVATDGLKGRTPNKVQRRFGNNDIDVMPVFNESPNDSNCFVRSNSAGDSDDNSQTRR
jgi:hypothetical protein